MSLNAAFRQWRGAGERNHRLAAFVKRWLSSRLDASFRHWRVSMVEQRRQEAEQKAELLGEQLQEQKVLHERGVMSRWLSRWVQRDLLAAFVKWQRRGEVAAASRRVMLRWLCRYQAQALLTWKKFGQASALHAMRIEMENEIAGVRAQVEQARMKRFVNRMMANRQLAAFRKWRGDGQRDSRMVKTWKRIHQRQLARGWRAWMEWLHSYEISRLKGLHSQQLSDMQILANQSLMRRVLRRLYNIREFAALRKWCEFCAQEREQFDRDRALMAKVVDKMCRADAFVTLDRRVFLAWRRWHSTHHVLLRQEAAAEKARMRDELKALEVRRLISSASLLASYLLA